MSTAPATGSSSNGSSTGVAEESAASSEPPDVERFCTRSTWKGCKAICQDVCTIALLAWIGTTFDHWLVYLAVTFCIGQIQFAMGEALLHEASHKHLFQPEHDFLYGPCQIFYAWPFLTTVEAYREDHHLHHVHLLKEHDYLDYARDGLVGHPNMFYYCFIQPLTPAPNLKWVRENMASLSSWYKRGCCVAFYAAAFAAAFALGIPDKFLYYWCVPLVVWFPKILYWSEMEEHYNTFSGARDNINPVENFFHHNEGYHWIHHRYPRIPFYNLPAATAALAPPGARDVSTGILDTYSQIKTPKQPSELLASHPQFTSGPLIDERLLARLKTRAVATHNPASATKDRSFASRVPDALEIKESPTGAGKGLFARAAFKKGEVICTNTSWILRAHSDPIHYEDTSPGGKLHEVHHIWTMAAPGFVYFSGFDGFMNHSCASNTHTRVLHEEIKPRGGRCEYEIVADRDIKVGDELTCCYGLLEFDSTDVNACLCGEASCAGKTYGFGKLPASLQAEYWDDTQPQIRRLFSLRQGLGTCVPTLAWFTPSQELIHGLRDYKYVSAPYTWIDRKLTPFWQWAGTLVPAGMHPNTITLAGFITVLYCFAVFAAAGTSAAITPSTFLSAALAMFFYQTMDCLDGIQARKLQLSSPVGQLFDHGLDAIVLTFGLTFFTRGLGLDQQAGSDLVSNALLTALVHIGGHANFYLTCWRERHLGGPPLKDVMYFGEVGVTSSEFSIMGVLILAGLHPAGPALFSDVVFALPAGAGALSLAQALALLVIALDAVSCGRSMWLTFRTTWTVPDGAWPQLPLNMWGEFWSFFVYIASSTLLLRHDGGVAWRPELQMYTVIAAGSIAALLVQNLLLYDMAGMPCDRFYVATLLHLAGSVAFSMSGAWWALAATAAVCAAVEAMWVVVMFGRLAKRLKISLFTCVEPRRKLV